MDVCVLCAYYFFFFNDTATTEIYTLSLHDALPIFHQPSGGRRRNAPAVASIDAHGEGAVADDSVRRRAGRRPRARRDRKSTRLNSSHANISYAVFCLKKKKKKKYNNMCLQQH